MFDPTPDISHSEQLSEVIRYVKIDYNTSTVDIREAVIDFITINKKDAAAYEHVICSKLQVDTLNFDDCRSQMYDNAAVISGHLTVVQARLFDKNPKAVFVNCDNHSLNHAGVQAASVDPTIVTFVGTIEQVYVFFSFSTGCWTQMTDKITVMVKRESDTRWKAREAAMWVIANSFDELVELLQTLNEDLSESSDT